MFVGDLDPNVNDNNLLEIFLHKYPSVMSSKVIYDNNKRSKCYGFIKFKKFKEFESALKEMNGYYVFNRAIKVNQANKKNLNCVNSLIFNNNGAQLDNNYFNNYDNSNSPLNNTDPKCDGNAFFPKRYIKYDQSNNAQINLLNRSLISNCTTEDVNSCLINKKNMEYQAKISYELKHSNYQKKNQYNRNNIFSYYFDLINYKECMDDIFIEYSKYGHSELNSISKFLFISLDMTFQENHKYVNFNNEETK